MYSPIKEEMLHKHFLFNRFGLLRSWNSDQKYRFKHRSIFPDQLRREETEVVLRQTGNEEGSCNDV